MISRLSLGEISSLFDSVDVRRIVFSLLESFQNFSHTERGGDIFIAAEHFAVYSNWQQT